MRVGAKFTRWTVTTIFSGRYCVVRCMCGVVARVRKADLLRERSRSCGCLRKETTRRLFTRHRGSGTLTYTSWYGMLQRCYNPKHRSYRIYGGRGITVCQRWRVSFENFKTDVGRRPSARYTLDRKRTNGNYTPRNCRWATRRQQALSRRAPSEDA